MSEVLDFPPIEAPPLVEAPKPPAVVAVVDTKTALVPVSIKAAVLAQFKEAETTVLALVEKYREVAFNVSTTKGMAEAKAARLELREKGRFALARAEKSVKADVNDLKRVMADEVERITALVMPVEESIDAQIKAEEERKAAARAAEAARVAAHEAGIAKIRAYLTRCQAPGMTAERINNGITLLAAVTFGPEWQEFDKQAVIAQTETLAAMRALHAKTVESEAAAAQAEAERVEREAEQQRLAAENARKAEELATRERELAAQAAELAERERVANVEKDRLANLQARVAAIHALPPATSETSSWAIFEAIVTMEKMDVSEAAFQEFAPMAADAKRIVLAALLQAKDAAVKREAAAPKAAEPARVTGGYSRRPAAAPVPVAAPADPPAVALDDADDGARIVADEPAEVVSDTTPAVDLFGEAPVAVMAAVDAGVALADCQAALREALLLVQDLVNNVPQSSPLADATRGILIRVAELRALGGI